MSGFAVEVREALDRRADELVRQGHASRTIDSAWRTRLIPKPCALGCPTGQP
jgi:hypothetical protein